MLVDKRRGNSGALEIIELVSSYDWVACDVFDDEYEKEVLFDDEMGMLTGAKTEKSD